MSHIQFIRNYDDLAYTLAKTVCPNGEQKYFNLQFLMPDLTLAGFFSACTIFILMVSEFQAKSGFITHIIIAI